MFATQTSAIDDQPLTAIAPEALPEEILAIAERGDIVLTVYQDEGTSTSQLQMLVIEDGILQAAPLLETERPYSNATYAPDCQTIGFSLYPALPGTTDILLLNLQTDAMQTVSLSLTAFEPGISWLPDGSGFVISGQDSGFWHLFSLSLSDLTMTRLTEIPNAFSPDVARNGRSIAFTYVPDVEPFAYPDLYKVNVDGTEPQLLVASDEESGTPSEPAIHGLYGPRYSPDSNWLVVRVTESLDVGVEYSRLYLVSSDGEEVRRLTSQNPVNPYVEPLYHEGTPAWSADSQTVLYSRLHQNLSGDWATELCFVDIVGGDSVCAPFKQGVIESLDWCSR